MSWLEHLYGVLSLLACAGMMASGCIVLCICWLSGEASELERRRGEAGYE